MAEVFLEGWHKQQQQQTALQLGRGCRMFPATGSWRREGVGWELGSNTWMKRGGKNQSLICRCELGERGQGCRRAWQVRWGSFFPLSEGTAVPHPASLPAFPRHLFFELSPETPDSASHLKNAFRSAHLKTTTHHSATEE